MVPVPGHQPKPRGSRVQPCPAPGSPVSGVCTLSHRRRGDEVREDRTRRLGTLWAGVSPAFHTPPLQGWGVPDIISAKRKKKQKTSHVSNYHQADFPRLICWPLFLSWCKNTKGKILLRR